MLQLKGKSVFEGIAVGTLKVIIHQTIDISAAKDFAPEAERQRFFSAREQTTTYLGTLYRRAIAGNVGGAEAEIFRMHRMMAEDLDFEDGVTAAIAEGHCAEYASLVGMLLLGVLRKTVDPSEFPQGERGAALKKLFAKFKKA